MASSNRAYVTNGRNQYTQITGDNPAALTWDANGNLTSDGSTTFGYDTENRLVSASGAKNATLSYDPLGRLYQVTSGGATTRFLYDGDRLIAEYNTAGTVQQRYVHGAGVDEPVVWYEGSAVSSATRRYLHANHQGSIVATTTAAGAKLGIGTYDAYGVTSAPSSWRFQYTGQAAIPQLGLYYYKARFYNPALGRFMQTDPIGYEDDNNLYAYVGNDPLNSRDPAGKFAIFVPVVVACLEFPACALGALTIAATVGVEAVQAYNEIDHGQGGNSNGNKSDGSRVRTDDKGKVHGDLPKAQDIPEDDLEKSAEALDESIGNRERAIDDHPVGDPSGNARERREHRQHEQHKERVRREKDLRKQIGERIRTRDEE